MMEEETNGAVTKGIEQNSVPNNSWSGQWVVGRVPEKEVFDLNPVEPNNINAKNNNG